MPHLRWSIQPRVHEDGKGRRVIYPMFTYRRGWQWLIRGSKGKKKGRIGIDLLDSERHPEDYSLLPVDLEVDRISPEMNTELFAADGSFFCSYMQMFRPFCSKRVASHENCPSYANADAAAYASGDARRAHA